MTSELTETARSAFSASVSYKNKTLSSLPSSSSNHYRMLLNVQTRNNYNKKIDKYNLVTKYNTSHQLMKSISREQDKHIV